MHGIEVTNLSKRYRKGRGISSFRELLAAKRTAEKEQYHWAVRDVSFAVSPGEALGIIGPNGAGKTTILKLLSRVTRPTEGSISVAGRFSSLIELGAGFHPDLTGRENIFLNGAILGMKRNEIQQRFDAIVDFAGIGDFLETPVKRYSSGMYARLGFAVAAHVDPDVLLVDEVLAVGDMAFQAKCYNRMNDMMARGVSLILVSHNMQAIQQVCRQAIVLFDGQVGFQGSSVEATAEYAAVLRSKASSAARLKSTGAEGLGKKRMTHGARIERAYVVDRDGNEVKAVTSGEDLRVIGEIFFYEDAPSPVFACTIYNERGQPIYDTTTHWQNITTPDFKAGEKVMIKFALQANLLPGSYSIKLDLAYADFSCYYDYLPDAAGFVISGDYGANGETNLFAEFHTRRISAQVALNEPFPLD